jgi:hypothetical protein
MRVALAVPVLAISRPSAVVRRHGWVVATRSGAPHGVRLTEVAGGLCLEVADSSSLERCTRVDLRADGVVRAYAATTPPALLVAAADVRTVPALPGGAETVRLDVGQRLLVLSSDALDALPVSLASVLQSLPARLADREPDELLRELTADLDVGSAAIVVRETHRPDLSEQPNQHQNQHQNEHPRDTEEATWGSALHS